MTQTFSYGSFDYKSYSNAYVLDLIVTEEAADPINNTSRLSYKLQLRSGPNNRFAGYLRAQVFIDEELVATRELIQVAAGYHKTDVLLTGQATAAHFTDGTGLVSVQAIVEPIGETVDNPYAPPAMQVEGQMPLTALAREAQVAAVNAFIGDTMSICVVSRDPAHKVTLHYQFGELEGYFADAFGTHSDSAVLLDPGNVLFSVPEEFYEQIPELPADIMTITCDTYLEDVCLGSSQTQVTVTADPARCGPQLTGNAIDINGKCIVVTQNSKRLIRQASNVKCTLSATARRGASIRQLYINDRPVEGDTHVLEAFDDDRLVYKAVDSRGYEVQYAVPRLTFLRYFPPTVAATASRTDPTGGQVRVQVRGRWYSGAFPAAANTLILHYKVDAGPWKTQDLTLQGDDFTADFTLQDLDYRLSHSLQLRVTDALYQREISLSVSRGVPVFHWGQEDFAFEVPVRFRASDGTVFTLDLVDGVLTAIT